MVPKERLVRVLVVICITAILGVAICGCDDLGSFSDVEEYYGSFGDIVLISGTTKERKEYSVKDYFYNKESRKNFLNGDDGAYRGVEHKDYVYMAIPFESDIEMDTLALYLESEADVSVYMNVYITDKIPENWQGIEDIKADGENTSTEENAEGETGETETGENDEPTYDDPDPETRIGEIAVHLKKGLWASFLLDEFSVSGTKQESIQIKYGQYILIQFRNNSGIRSYNEEKQLYVDPQTGIALQKAEITATNLLIRALSVENESEVQGGE